ncbi:hypothetical protein GCM10011360_17660 [Primorskyibacter flagellatus]|uniref:Uncharacterized protein n=1 Tax=Primorskyibacter flagellatus TaxID=1387277 RepID=A0A917EE23_9RHOB|nr:hypothetical protein [Primorskyibacter flagellatus]GGE30038.1 hypothetical protein GCM10011360_17660 [Primorskyibacter flagellatus]
MITLSLRSGSNWSAPVYVAGIILTPRPCIAIRPEPVPTGEGCTLDMVAAVLDEIVSQSGTWDGYRLTQAAFVREVAA